MKQLAAIQKPTASPTALTASPSPAAETTDPTAGWRTYSNSEFGFSLKYPADFGNQGVIASPFTGDSKFIQSFSDPSTVREGTDAPFNGFSVYAVSNMNTSDLNEYINNEIQAMNAYEYSRMQNPKRITITGGSALVTDIQGYYYLPNKEGNKLIVLVYLQANDTFKPVFNQILATFKFTQ